MKIALSTESCADLPAALKEQYDIHTIAYSVVMGDKEGKDGDIKGEDLFRFYDETKTLAHTAAINTYEFKEYFLKLLETYDQILHISLSSEITSATEHAILAAKEVEAETGKRIEVIDSRSLSTGLGIQAVYARKLLDEGKSLEETANLVRLRSGSVQCSFGCERVDYLYKGGRCSAVAALAAGMFNIRPQIILKDGKMVAGRKFRGKFAKWVPDYVELTLDECPHPDLSTVFITYSSAEEETLVKMRKVLKDRGFQNVYDATAGATISCHCGPKTLGIIFYNDGPKA